MQASILFPNIAPEIFSLTVGGINIALRWYALAYIAGILLGWFLARQAVTQPKLWRNGQAAMSRENVDDFILWVVIAVILGGRLGYVLFYQPSQYLQNPEQILAIWRGGMSFHGGLIGVICAAWLYTGRYKLNRLSAADLITLCVPPGLLFGRLANFINAELWGRPTQLPWGVVFPGDAAQSCATATELCARHPSQIYEALLEGLILGGILVWLAWRRGAFHRPGFITAVFFLGYGLSRFAVEFVRQPDPQFISAANPLGFALHISGYGVTMGQVLCVPMLLVGIWFLKQARRSA
ncbi:MAG: prolipoprotein diacylglyceryl transferase [Aestuariivita sp.]|nr:prolipoprotein diacylglyceryl transferase [Aestuariivita sp.]MCY4202122.1 prolipoprotein diacylglyceryl transferase [Aestuariivita sp.]